MTHCELGPRAGTADRPELADTLLGSALDMAGLLIEHVIEPGLVDDETIDFTKEIAEVAMLLRLVERAWPPLAARVAGLAQRIAPIARGSRVSDQLIGRPSRATPHLLAHACLQQLGCRDEQFHQLALQVVRASAATAEERVPYRLLDSGWIRHLLLDDAQLAHPALAVSPVSVGVDLIGATVEDAYALSHALPYATDFGRVALPDWADRTRLAETVDALILKALAEDDLDLLGELLMAPALLRQDWSSVQWFGWQVLIQTWAQYGFVPGPGLPAAAAAETDAAARRRVLGTVYHTTLVAGLLVATLAKYDDWAAGGPPAAPVCSVQVIGDELAWQRCWQALSPSWQAALAAAPAGIALHHAVSSSNMPAIIDCLQAPTLDLLPGVLVTQTLEFLDRLALAVTTIA